MTAEQRVRQLPFWQGAITVSALTGGASNAGFKVTDATGDYVARVGDDYPCHHVSRSREMAASRAAFAAGLSPEAVYNEPGIIVVRFITGKTFGEADVQANLGRCIDLVKICHRDMASHVLGPCGVFWVFQLLRDYANTLKIANHAGVAKLPRLMAINARMEANQVAMPMVFGHHDLLPGNLIDDGKRLWLIDWEYGGFGTAMFDLANLASNNGISGAAEYHMLEQYFDGAPGEETLRAYDAMKVAAALREALWGMVSEVHLNAPGVDYVAYAETYLARFEAILANYEERYGKS